MSDLGKLQSKDSGAPLSNFSIDARQFNSVNKKILSHSPPPSLLPFVLLSTHTHTHTHTCTHNHTHMYTQPHTHMYTQPHTHNHMHHICTHAPQAHIFTHTIHKRHFLKWFICYKGRGEHKGWGGGGKIFLFFIFLYQPKNTIIIFTQNCISFHTTTFFQIPIK